MMGTNKFPVVMLDRTTTHEMLPMFMHRGLFSNYSSLPDRSEILENAKAELGVECLTKEQERKALTDAREYKSATYVFRDYGNYVIAFSARLYLDHIQGIEKVIESKQQNNPNNIVDLEKALERIRLYKLAHKVALIILSEAYIQRKYEELEITKEKIINYLGLDANDKYIYQDISDVMFSLRWLDYQKFEYKTKNPLSKNRKSFGNFIYNVEEDAKSFKVWVNKMFFGCVEHLITDEKHNKDERSELFERGYVKYPTSLIPLTKDYSGAAYMLVNFLVTDSGNAKLKEGNLKVVAYKGSKLITEARIEHSRISVAVKELIESLEAIELIEKTEPNIDELKLMKPNGVYNTVIKIYIKSSSAALDTEIKSNLLCAKCG